jgi:hypothetical protein
VQGIGLKVLDAGEADLFQLAGAAAAVLEDVRGRFGANLPELLRVVP